MIDSTYLLLPIPERSTTDRRLVAEQAGIRLHGLPVERIGIGGHSITARAAVMQVTLSGFTWEAPVWFCDPWPFAFQLLGQEGFFRWFTVTINAADRNLDIHPIDT